MNRSFKVVVDGHVGRVSRRRRVLRYLFAAVVTFVLMFCALMWESRAFAGELPEIFMGTFCDVADGDEVAQMPEDGDVISTAKTVVIKGSRWKLMSGFKVAGVKSSDGKVVGVSLKKKQAVIKAKDVGRAVIVLSGDGGEAVTYEIFVEDPKVKSIKVVDFVRLYEAEYITGVKYLRPTAVSVNKRKIGKIYHGDHGESVLNVFGSGKAKITVKYGSYKRTGSINARLPRMVSKNVKLKNRPKRIKIANVPRGLNPVFRSTDTDVAICNSEGYVAPVGNGTATIYTRVGNTYLICHVSVSGFTG